MYGESYGAQDMTGFSWLPKFYMKNLEKVERIINIQEDPTISAILCTLNVDLHMDMSELKYLSHKDVSLATQ